MKKIILSLLLVIVGVVALGQAVYADNATLSVLPASSDNKVGSAFNVSIQLNPANNKVCVVSGNLIFSNLSCQNITVASSLKAMTAPSCSNTSFMLGIPNCAATVQNLFSVSVKGVQAGQANLSFTGVKVIGAGTDVAFSPQNGAYNITAPVLAQQPVVQPKEQSVAKVQPKATSETANTEASTTETVSEDKTENSLTAVEEENNLTDQPAALGQTEPSSLFSNRLIWLIIIVVLLGAGIWWFYSKNKNIKK